MKSKFNANYIIITASLIYYLTYNKPQSLVPECQLFVDCGLIKNDSIQEFVVFVNKTNLSLRTTIKPSIFDTNSFLINSKETSLIEYIAFFGSIQIFKYFQINNVELKPSLWNYVIHGNYPDMIHILEENKIGPISKSFKECYIEAIKCHHNDLSNYSIS